LPREEQTETKVLSAHFQDLRLRRFVLTVVQGLDAGATATSDGEDFSIGTAQGNQLVVRDPAVSRHHCVIITRPSGFLIRDLGSTNGTVVNGMRIESGYLNRDAELRVGITHLKFSASKETVRHPLSAERSFSELMGTGLAMRRLFALLPRVAASDAAVLIQGETGTGKSLLARAIHGSSPRADGPIVVVNSASIPPTLIEAELFGHERGAFTGAEARRAGAFEQARGGTLVLEEIGELPLSMQPKLLTALEDRVIRPIGCREPLKTDCRIVASTNRDLRYEVNRGTFRSDLFYRLNTVTLRLPPLRERREDIPLLTEHFLREFGASDRKQELEGMLAATWAGRDWTGNVRELRSAVQRAVLLGMDQRESWRPAPSSWPPPPSSKTTPAEDIVELGQTFREAKEAAIAKWEERYVAALLARHDQNLSRAAREVEMDRNYLRTVAKKYGLLK
jgi:two-component system, NtrC family, response regulator GlrR